MKVDLIRENLLALFLAFVLAFFVMFLISKTDFLKADILWVQDNQENVIEWDAVFYLDDWHVVIQSNKNIDWVNSVSFLLSYNPEAITIDEDFWINSSYNFSTSKDDWLLNVLVIWLWNIEKWSEIARINVLWSQDFNLSDFVVSFTNWSAERLSISSK